VSCRLPSSVYHTEVIAISRARITMKKYSAAKIPTMRVLQSLTLRLSLFFDE
jgi:hypothetical protein